MKQYGRKVNKKPVAKRPYKKRVYRKRVYKVRARRILPSMEKKQIKLATDSPIAFGQVIANSTGHCEVNVTPLPSAGSGHNNRIGRKISITSLFFQFQFYQMSSALHPTKIRMLLVQQMGKPITTGITADLLQPNDFLIFGSIYDYNSLRNVKNFKNFRILVNRTITIQADSAPSNERMITNTKVGRRFKYPINIAYDDLTSNVTNGGLALILLADSGNASGITASTLTGVPVLGINTGVLMNYNLTYYYTDM